MRLVRKADNLPPSCAVVTKFGNLNFLETSRPVRACNGTALPLLFWAIKQQTVMFPYRSFGTTCRYIFKGQESKNPYL